MYIYVYIYILTDYDVLIATSLEMMLTKLNHNQTAILRAGETLKLLFPYIYIYIYLVGGFKHFLFSIRHGIVLPIDFHIFQRG
jgi:hypothetical protein